MGVVDLLGVPGAGGCVADHRDGPVRAAAGQDQAQLVWRPADRVHRRVVAGVLVQLAPAAARLLPDDDAAVVGARRKNRPVHRVRPGHLPHLPAASGTVCLCVCLVGR